MAGEIVNFLGQAIWLNGDMLLNIHGTLIWSPVKIRVSVPYDYDVEREREGANKMCMECKNLPCVYGFKAPQQVNL